VGNNVELSQGQEEGSELLGVVGKGDFDEGEVDDDLEGVEHGPDELHGGGEDEVDDEADKGGDVGDLANSFGGSPLEPSEALALLRWELGLERGLLPDQLVGFLGNEDLVGADLRSESKSASEKAEMRSGSLNSNWMRSLSWVMETAVQLTIISSGW